MRIPITVLVLTVILSLTAWQPSQADRTPSADFEPHLSIENIALSLTGAGVLTYLGFIPIYHGALYMPPGVNSERVLENVPKRLEVIYLRPFTAEDIGTAADEGIRKIVSPGMYDRLASRIADHNSLYEDMAKGDRAALTYLPERGITLTINGREKGTIPGEDFAQALFGLWLGDEPFDNRFKQALLGENR
jgi:hypothetical protein